MDSNLLVLNRYKTQLMIVSKDTELHNNLYLKDIDEDIKPVEAIKYLGIEIHNSLKWNYFLSDSKNSLITQLNNRLKALKLTRKVIDKTTACRLANWRIPVKVAVCN